MMGNMLRERDQQYIANRDDGTKTWRILDTWHESLIGYDVDDEVQDDSPALKILTEGEFIVLIREAARIGVLENANLDNGSEENEDFSIMNEEYESHLVDCRLKTTQDTETITTLTHQNATLQHQVQRSEGFVLKEKAMSSILKVVAMADVEQISKD